MFITCCHTKDWSKYVDPTMFTFKLCHEDQQVFNMSCISFLMGGFFAIQSVGNDGHEIGFYLLTSQQTETKRMDRASWGHLAIGTCFALPLKTC